MRHKKSFNHLGRKSAHRKAMLSNMASSLIIHKRIQTTTAKAKALKRYVEPLITRSREDSTHSRRVVFSYLQDKEAVSELFREVSPKVGDRPGGYTRIIKLGARQGDSAEMCLIELVDYNENLLADKEAAKKSTSRRRRGGKSRSGKPAAAETTGKVASESPAVAAPVTEEGGEETREEATAEAPAAEEATAEVADEPESHAETAAEEDTGEEAESKSEEEDNEKKE